MPTITVTEFRRKGGKILDRVEKGERFVITRRGKPLVALISEADADILRQWEEFGLRIRTAPIAE